MFRNISLQNGPVQTLRAVQLPVSLQFADSPTRQDRARTKPVSGDGLAEDKGAFMTKTKRARQFYTRVAVLPPPPPWPPRPSPLAIVRLPFSATARDNERKLLLLIFRGKITPVEARHAPPRGDSLQPDPRQSFFAFLARPRPFGRAPRICGIRRPCRRTSADDQLQADVFKRTLERATVTCVRKIRVTVTSNRCRRVAFQWFPATVDLERFR